MQARAVLVLKAQQHDARIRQTVVSSPVVPQHTQRAGRTSWRCGGTRRCSTRLGHEQERVQQVQLGRGHEVAVIEDACQAGRVAARDEDREWVAPEVGRPHASAFRLSGQTGS